MNDEHETERDQQRVSGRRTAPDYDTRSERRTLRGAARRRKTRARLWLVLGPAVIVIAAIVVVLVLVGRPGGSSAPLTTSTTLVEAPADSGDLLLVEEGDSLPVLLFVQVRDDNGLVLAVPGITLVKTSDGFRTLADMQAGGESEAMHTALAEELGVRARSTASIPWPELRDAMITALVTDLPPETLAAAGEESEQMARALMALVAEGNSETGRMAWEQLALEGDAAPFREHMRAAASAVAADRWSSAALTGRLVVGEDFAYMEPDTAHLEIFLLGPTEGAAITVEIQNGAGMVGVVEQATLELASLGYTLVPAGNSADFPDAQGTRIVAAPDAVEAAARVGVLLGASTITEDSMLDPGHITVVLGKDYAPTSPATTVPSG